MVIDTLTGPSLLILPALLAFLVIAGIIEHRRHRQALARIPIRIHVNGTRGKSSVTRLIAAGLRAGGIRTIAKTTGSAARLIWENGRETPVVRHGPPSVREQIKVIIRAATRDVQALVLECMAVQPEYQRFTEHLVVKATHGVITNAREDHLDVMGPTVEDVAWALSNTMPKRAKAFTAEHKMIHPFQQTAAARETTLTVTQPAEADVEAAKGFSYLEHPENIALALAVCQSLGIDRETALHGMWEARPDIGALQAWEIAFFEKRLFFVNALAANDPESTLLACERARHSVPSTDKTIVLFNNRGDRLSRAQQFGKFIATRWPSDHCVLIGQLTKAVEDQAIREGLDAERITNLGDASPAEVFEKVLALTPSTALVVAVGNIVGLGEEVASYFQNRGKALGTGVSGSRSCS
ncbi:poly-gamma-glutamate synthase PgsB [Candidatus Fermentibacteria bacterium]|nr:poly-gamma-glutamate synthase PgsB [Candidatus Fermentibacteria bacterium]